LWQVQNDYTSVSVRYCSDGALDTTFQDNGKLFYDFEGASCPSQLQTDGKLIMANNSTIVRYDINMASKPKYEQKVVELPKRKEPDPNSFIPVQSSPKVLNIDEVKQKIATESIVVKRTEDMRATFRILVDENGNYVRHLPVRGASNDPFVGVVEKYIADLRFSPAMQGGKAIMFWVNIPFVFNVEK